MGMEGEKYDNSHATAFAVSDILILCYCKIHFNMWGLEFGIYSLMNA
jgi:hypothetical protein